MVTLGLNGISWFLDDEGLVAAVKGLAEEKDLRRTYAVVSCGSEKVFVKYFLEKGVLGFVRNRLANRGKREYTLGKKMSEVGVVTPGPLGYGVGQRGSFVLQKWVKGITLKQAFDEQPEKRILLVGQLAVLLRQLKTHGIRHNDLHLENVILSGQRPCLIDLHKTRIKKAFSQDDELSNLTHALNMIYDDLTGEEKDTFFQCYGQSHIRPLVEAGLRELWATWIKNKKRRSFSSTSKLEAREGRVCIRGCEGRGDGELKEVIKTDKKVRVERRSDHVRKIYRNRRRLVKAWENHVALEYMRLDIVPRPFYVQKSSLLRKGYIAMEDLGGRGEELDRFLDRRYDGMSWTERHGFVSAFSRFLRNALKKDVFHMDMKACNVFVLSGGFKLLDAEDLVFVAVEEERLRRMLVQLNTTMPARVAVSDRIRFFSDLTKGLPINRKRLLREVAEQCRSTEIVYEGVSGLKREAWPVHRQCSHSPFSRVPRS